MSELIFAGAIGALIGWYGGRSLERARQEDLRDWERQLEGSFVGRTVKRGPVVPETTAENGEE